jgi:hypothetical protein
MSKGFSFDLWNGKEEKRYRGLSQRCMCRYIESELSTNKNRGSERKAMEQEAELRIDGFY